MSSRDTGRGLMNLAGSDDLHRLRDVGFLHAEALQAGRQSDPHIEVVETLAGVLGAEGAGDQLHRARRGLGVERNGIGREDRMAVRMIEPEALPHPLRQRMLDTGLRAEGGGEPGAVQRVGARRDVVRPVDHARQARSQQFHRLRRQPFDHRVDVGAVERLDRMGHGVHAAGGRGARRQRERQVGIVDRGQRQAIVVVARHPVRTGADRPARRHLRAGIGRDHRDRAQAGLGGDGLGEADRRAAADHDQAVGVLLLGVLDQLGQPLAGIAGLRQLMDIGDAARGLRLDPLRGRPGSRWCTGSGRASACAGPARPVRTQACRGRTAHGRPGTGRQSSRSCLLCGCSARIGWMDRGRRLIVS